MSTPMFGRDTLLAAADTVLSEMAAGRPVHFVLNGVSGVGKTALLRKATEQAEAKGCQVLRAQAHPLEQDYAFGVVRQLFQPALAALTDADRDGMLSGVVAPAKPVVWPGGGPGIEPGDTGFAVLHALTALAGRLAELAPLVLVVDDLQWGDGASLQWLCQFLRGTDGTRAVLMTARTTGLHGTQDDLVEELVARLCPVGVGGLALADVVAFAAAAFGTEPEDVFVEACHRATGGNPFLLRALMSALAEAGVRPDREAVGAVTEFSSQRVSTWVLTRIRRADPRGAAVAEAVVILGEDAELPEVAALAGIGVEEAGQAARALSGMGLMYSWTSLRFVHSIVRDAVDGEIRQGRRRAAHAQAARILERGDHEPEQVSAHLLACDPIGEPWAAEVLRAAARTALNRGVSRVSARYLHRALDECLACATRFEVLAELGRAELAVDVRAASAHLNEAFEGLAGLAEDEQPEAAFVAQVVTDLTVANGVWSPAGGVPERAAKDLAERAPELAVAMDGFGIAAGMNFPGFPLAERLERLRKMAVGYPDSERFAAVMTAQYRSALGESREETVRQALRANEMSDDRSAMALLAYLHGCIVFNRAEEFDLSSRYVETLVNTAPLAGKPLFAEYGHGLGGVLAFHTGRLADAVDEIRAAIDIRDGVSRGAVSPSAWEAMLIRAELARGEIVAAEAILASVGALEQWLPFYYAPVLLAGRGLVRAHLGDLEGALADHRESGRRQAEFEVINPADNPWRSRAALLCHRLDRPGEAEELAREELALARTWGAPAAIGFALTALGRVTSDIEPLAESLALLENTQSRLVYAVSAFQLGLAHHRASHRSDARALLEIAHRVATECGADRLAEQSAQALTRVAGRRPNAPKFGAEALTAQERRIAGRAALGAGNRQIAEELFLTLRTVEHHLTAVYRKLGVEGRAGLAGIDVGDSSAGS